MKKIVLNLIVLVTIITATPMGWIEKYGNLTADSLVSQIESVVNEERAVLLLFITSTGSDMSGYCEEQYREIQYYYTNSENSVELALLGTSAALMARDCENELSATKYVAQAQKMLDKAVESDPNDPTIRIFRINSLVEVPQFFDVNSRLLSDVDFLEKRGELSSAEKIAIASVKYRLGLLNEAISLWLDVIETSGKNSLDYKTAQRLLEEIHG